MSKLKEKDGKYYQECEVVMLATKEVIGEASIMQEDDKLYPVREFGNRNIYFLSNEEIKEPCWCINKNRDTLIFLDYNKGQHYNPNNDWNKIIATTDTSLEFTIDKSPYPMEIYSLPQPSKSFIQAFIRAYNESKPITKVLVEVEYIVTNEDWSKNPVQLDGYSQLKVNSSNEITIKKIKDSWAREEVSQMLADFLTDCWNKDYQFNGLAHDEVANKFIEENL